MANIGAHQVAAQLASFNDTAAKLRPLRGQLNAVTAVASAADTVAVLVPESSGRRPRTLESRRNCCSASAACNFG